ncbi:MAG: hypothetical protein Q4G03_11510, partial [Planctomycetia bacterium]|nr:hypothetical protein [Planctomycetia bacterium]
MGWKLLYQIEKSARATDNYQKTVEEIYELDSAEDFDPFLISFKKKGGVLIERRRGLAFYFTVENVEMTRRPPSPAGKLQVVATVTLSLLKQSEEELAPWNLPPYDFRIRTSGRDETVRRFYPGQGDILFPHGAFEPQPLMNTAGVLLKCKTTMGLSTVEFSYNTALDAFDPRLVWAAQGKINLYAVTICGLTFPPRTVKIEAFNAQYCHDESTTTDQLGNQTTTAWKYYRVDVKLQANPRSYDQLFANAGVHVYRNGTLARIWRWSDDSQKNVYYGSYQEYLASGARNGEAITENVFLDATGRRVSIDPKYRIGS